MTGLARVAGCNTGDLESEKRRAQYDLYYVEHRSALLDLRTLIRTLSVLLGPPRADGEAIGAGIEAPSASRAAQ